MDGGGRYADGEGKDADGRGRVADGGGRYVDGGGKDVDGGGRDADGGGKDADSIHDMTVHIYVPRNISRSFYDGEECSVEHTCKKSAFMVNPHNSHHLHNSHTHNSPPCKYAH